MKPLDLEAFIADSRELLSKAGLLREAGSLSPHDARDVVMNCRESLEKLAARLEILEGQIPNG